jgi:hypothetical protein
VFIKFCKLNWRTGTLRYVAIRGFIRSFLMFGEQLSFCYLIIGKKEEERNNEGRREEEEKGEGEKKVEKI